MKKKTKSPAKSVRKAKKVTKDIRLDFYTAANKMDGLTEDLLWKFDEVINEICEDLETLEDHANKCLPVSEGMVTLIHETLKKYQNNY
jgi:hypothetical protein